MKPFSIKRVINTILSIVVIFSFTSCIKKDYDSGDFNPWSDRHNPNISLLGFYIGNTMLCQVQERSSLFVVDTEVWCGEVTVDDMEYLLVYARLYTFEDLYWEDNNGNIIRIGGSIWLCLPFDNVTIGEKIAIDNPDNAILCSKRLISDLDNNEQRYKDTRLKTLSFESLSVVYEDITDNNITCSFEGEVFLDCIKEPTTIKIEYGKVQIFRRGDRSNCLTYESWQKYSRENLNWD